MARKESIDQIVNDAALEVGLTPVASPFTSTDDSFAQLVGLLNSAGRELVELHPWQSLVKSHQITTDALDTGTYTLPTDFCYMIDQTGWERENNIQLGGPLSAQDWTYLAGRDMASSTIHVSFRLLDNKFDVYPNSPVPDGLDINFDYVNRNWLSDSAGTSFYDRAVDGTDLVQMEPILVVKFLKAKFLESKGFDASAARIEFENMFLSRTGKDEGAPILSISGGSRGYPYLNKFRSTPDTNYGV